MKVERDCFRDYLDSVFVINKEAKESFGEDSFYCANCAISSIVCVTDGCGGLGARKYETYAGNTGAYMAARTVTGAVHDWYHTNYKKRWTNADELAESIEVYIRKAYSVCEAYGTEKRKILGSMVRKFPTTLALAYAEKRKKGIMLHVLWAGDSRIYLLDEKGLAQLSVDDTEVDDALESILSDGTLTNVLSSDGKYEINRKTIWIDQPAIIFAATDGCFDYIPCPMEFEYVILENLKKSETPVLFKNNLKCSLSGYAGDDLTLGWMSFGFGDFNSTRKILAKRLDVLKKDYIDVLQYDRNEECIRQLWSTYKLAYERFLK